MTAAKAKSREARPNDNAVRFERGLLSCVLERPDLLGEVSQISRSEHFLLSDHRILWNAMLKLQTFDFPILAAAVSDKIDPAVIAGLCEPGFITAHVRTYAQRVHDAAIERACARKVEQLSHDVSREDRLRHIRELEELLAESSTDGGGIRRSEDIPDPLALDAPECTPLIADILYPATLVMLSGPPGAGKSLLSECMSINLATGGIFLARRCVKSRVLILDHENPLFVIQQRYRLLAGGPIPDVRFWGSWLVNDPPPSIGDERLRAIAREEKPVIIFDSFVRFHGSDENSSKEMKIVMAQLRELVSVGATVILLHHVGKQELSRFRGSSDILAAVDAAWSLSFDEEDQQLKLEQYKNRFGEKRSIMIRADFAAGRFEATDAPAEFPQAANQRQRRDNVELLLSIIEAEPGISQTKVAERSGLRREDAFKILKDKTGKLWRTEIGERKARLYFPLTGSHDRFPTSSHVKGLDRFREPVPEEAWTGSHIDSHCTEPVIEGPPVPDPSSPYIEGEEGTCAHLGTGERPNGKTHWPTARPIPGRVL